MAGDPRRIVVKRSQANQIIRVAKDAIARAGFALPPFAYWSPEDWRTKGSEAAEIPQRRLGWDITDFGSGDFAHCGLTLFTVRNGTLDAVKRGTGKSYCEKIGVMEVGQRCPDHHHFVKVEDIINRAGGDLVIQLHRSDKAGSFTDDDIQVSVDGVARTVPSGGLIRLTPGESVTLDPGVYHGLWPEGERVVFGEVSVVNDDFRDNRFHQPVGRFPDIDEDEPPQHLLLGDYPEYYRPGA